MSIVLKSNPLWVGDGPRFLSALLDIPMIQKRSWRALCSFFVKQPAVIARYTKHQLLLGLFGLCTTAFVATICIKITSHLFLYLEEQFRGTGVALFILIYASVGWQLNRLIRSKKRLPQPLLRTCRHHCPGELVQCLIRSLPARWQPSPCRGRVGVRITFRDLFGVHSHYGLLAR